MTPAAETSTQPQKLPPERDQTVDAVPPGGAGKGKTHTALLPEAQLMDIERLAQFREFDDEHLTMTREVIGLFIADASQRLDVIEQSIRASDPVALAWATHALAGATGNVGAIAMQAVCIQLELTARTGCVPADAAQQLVKLQSYWTQTRAILRSWV